MNTETLILTALILVLALVLTRRLHRRHRHSLIYRLYIDNDSWLWRKRKQIWYWTSDKKCEHCRTKLAPPGRRPRSYRRRYPVATFDHKNYRHLLFERRGRDIQMLCWNPCHLRKDAHRFR